MYLIYLDYSRLWGDTCKHIDIFMRHCILFADSFLNRFNKSSDYLSSHRNPVCRGKGYYGSSDFQLDLRRYICERGTWWHMYSIRYRILGIAGPKKTDSGLFYSIGDCRTIRGTVHPSPCHLYMDNLLFCT